jgi:hypothetical protein
VNCAVAERSAKLFTHRWVGHVLVGDAVEVGCYLFAYQPAHRASGTTMLAPLLHLIDEVERCAVYGQPTLPFLSPGIALADL